MYCYKACVLAAKKSSACLFLATLNLFREEAVMDFGTEKKAWRLIKRRVPTDRELQQGAFTAREISSLPKEQTQQNCSKAAERTVFFPKEIGAMQRLLQLRKSLKITSLKRDIFHSALQEHSGRRENAYSFL